MNSSEVQVRGSEQKQVTCESCGHQYKYTMRRTAVGSFSGFATTREEADARAEADAIGKLKARLSSECDITLCPKCERLTKQMQDYKARFETRMEGAQNIFPLLCLGAMVLGALVAGHGMFYGRWSLKLSFLGAALFVSGLSYLFMDLAPPRKGPATPGDLDVIRQRVLAAGLATSANVDEVISKMDVQQFLDIRAELRHVTRSQFKSQPANSPPEPIKFTIKY